MKVEAKTSKLLLVIKIPNCVPFNVICMETAGIFVVFAIIGIRNTERIFMSEVLEEISS